MVTLKDIADKAGVNKSTVSRALSGKGIISEDKRAEISRIAEELGYVPNASAKILAGEKAKTIGIILPEIDCNYYASVAGTIENRLKEMGYSLIIGQTGFEFENELHYLELFVRKNLDGIIFDLYNHNKFLMEFKRIKKSLNVPIVFIECPTTLTDYDVINIDNYHGVDLAVEHLKSLGHKRIGFISEYLSSPVRLPAFTASLEKHGLPVDQTLIKIGKERLEEGGYLRMRELLTTNPTVTAVFASYDTMAQGAMKAIMEHGLRIPEDISIVGFDNIRESAYFSTPLTTVAPPVTEMGGMAVNILMDKTKNDASNLIQHVSLKPRLVIRNSTAKCK